MNDRDLLRSLTVEFLGPFALTFMGVGAIIATQGQDIVAIALAHGLAIGLMIVAAGHISGGHYNPAITIAMWVTKRIELNRAIAYIGAQLAGALVAAGALTLCFRDVDRNAEGINMGVPSVGANLSAGNALAMEIILSFFFIFVIFGAAVDTRTPKTLAGLCIGLVITMDVFAGGAVSGAAMNPSRWFGVAIVQGDFKDFWVWWVGPIVGAVAAAVLYSNWLLDTTSGETLRTRIIEDGEDEAQETPVRASAAQAQRSRRSQRRR